MEKPETASNPPIARGQRIAAESRTIADVDQGERVSFRLPIDHTLPPQEITRPQEDMPKRVGPTIEDVGALAEGPSVWEALQEDGVGPQTPKE